MWQPKATVNDKISCHGISQLIEENQKLTMRMKISADKQITHDTRRFRALSEYIEIVLSYRNELIVSSLNLYDIHIFLECRASHIKI